MLKSLKYVVAMGLIALGYADSAKAGMFDDFKSNMGRQFGRAAGPGTLSCTSSIAKSQKTTDPKNYAFALRCATEVPAGKIRKFADAFSQTHCQKATTDKKLKRACSMMHVVNKIHAAKKKAEDHKAAAKKALQRKKQHLAEQKNKEATRRAMLAAKEEAQAAKEAKLQARRERDEAKQAHYAAAREEGDEEFDLDDVSNGEEMDDMPDLEDDEETTDGDQDGATGGDEGDPYADTDGEEGGEFNY